jgi:hypothetical protein
MDTIPILVGLSLTVGVGLIVNAITATILDIGRRMYGSMGRRRGRLAILGLRNSQQRKEALMEDDVLGLAVIPWGNLYAAAALVGLLGFAWIGPHVPTFRLAFLFAPAIVWGLKRYLAYQQRRFLPGQIRQLLIDIRVHMSLSGSLLLGLDSMARSTQETSIVYRALKRRMAGGLAKSGLDVLQQLAADVKSPHLLRATQRIRSAQQSSGLLGIDQAISHSIEELNEEIATACEEQIQHLPLRITLLAMPFLLGPIVILLFYPLVDRILKTLAGAAIGGGF